MATNYDYLIELANLATGLTLKGIHFEFKTLYDGGIIIVFDKAGNRVWDAICHSGSYGSHGHKIPYGYKNPLLEIMGDIVNKELSCGDEVEGWLTAKDILERL